MEELLIKTGLTELQAQVYLYLLKNGATLPPYLTERLKITRTNTYKVLESLEKLGLVSKETTGSKIVYTAEDPAALVSLVAEKRNNIIALEKNVNNAMQQLRKSFARSQSDTKVHIRAGKDAIVKEYDRQAELRQPIYFVKTRADIPFMGFEVMNTVRAKQGALAPHRYGITPDSPEASANTAIDKHTHLSRTWIDEKDYTAPVEWSVSGDSLVVQTFEGSGRTVSIQDQLIADSFRQLWQLLDKALRGAEAYKTLPHKAKRAI